jgi:predicted negative regulator of RcsB-dependent stress response
MPTARGPRTWERADLICGGLFAVFAAGAAIAAADQAKQLALPFAIVAMVGALAGLGLKTARVITERRIESRRRLRAAPFRAARLIDPNLLRRLGVDTEAPDVRELLGLVGDQAADYAPRTIDHGLRTRLTDAAPAKRVELIVVAGPSKAGKSRAALEAIRDAAPAAVVLAPRDPEALEELVALGPPLRPAADSYIIWVDDIELFARRDHGLNDEALDDLGRWHRGVAVVATEGGKGVDLAGETARRFGEVTADLLARNPPIRLDPALDDAEMASLPPTFPPAAADRIACEGLGEFMIAAPRLLDRLRHGRHPDGQAVARAAIDAQRAGLLEPLKLEDLRALFAHHLPGPVTDARFDAGIEWATAPLYATVALMTRRAGELDGYRPHPFLVDHEARHTAELDNEAWDRALVEIADHEDGLLRIAAVAQSRRNSGRAELALHKGDDLGSARAALELGKILIRRGDMTAAESYFRRAGERGLPDGWCNLGGLLSYRRAYGEALEALTRAETAGHVHAAVRLGMMQSQLGDTDAAAKDFERADQGGDPQAPGYLGKMLLQRGDTEGAIEAYRRSDERGCDWGACQLGQLLEPNDLEAAEAAYRRAEARGHHHAAVRLAGLLRERADFDRAEKAYRRAFEAGEHRGDDWFGWLLSVRGAEDEALEVFRAGADHGNGYCAWRAGEALEARGELEAARTAYERGIELGDLRSHRLMAELLDRLGDEGAARRAFQEAQRLALAADEMGDADAAFNLAFVLRWRGEEEQAIAAFTRADERGDMMASVWLGVALETQGDQEGAKQAYRRGAGRGSADGASYYGAMLQREGDWAGAEDAYALADARQGAHGAWALGNLLRSRARFAEALAAYTRADRRLHAEGALELGSMLEGDGAHDSAMAAYERAKSRALRHGKYDIAALATERLDSLTARVTSSEPTRSE